MADDIKNPISRFNHDEVRLTAGKVELDEQIINIQHL
jgi:hypothetical protein